MTSEAPSAAPPRGNTLIVVLVAGGIAFLLGLAAMAAGKCVSGAMLLPRLNKA